MAATSPGGGGEGHWEGAELPLPRFRSHQDWMTRVQLELSRICMAVPALFGRGSPFGAGEGEGSISQLLFPGGCSRGPLTSGIPLLRELPGCLALRGPGLAWTTDPGVLRAGEPPEGTGAAGRSGRARRSPAPSRRTRRSSAAARGRSAARPTGWGAPSASGPGTGWAPPRRRRPRPPARGTSCGDCGSRRLRRLRRGAPWGVRSWPGPGAAARAPRAHTSLSGPVQGGQGGSRRRGAGAS